MHILKKTKKNNIHQDQPHSNITLGFMVETKKYEKKSFYRQFSKLRKVPPQLIKSRFFAQRVTQIRVK